MKEALTVAVTDTSKDKCGQPRLEALKDHSPMRSATSLARLLFSRVLEKLVSNSVCGTQVYVVT